MYSDWCVGRMPYISRRRFVWNWWSKPGPLFLLLSWTEKLRRFYSPPLQWLFPWLVAKVIVSKSSRYRRSLRFSVSKRILNITQTYQSESGCNLCGFSEGHSRDRVAVFKSQTKSILCFLFSLQACYNRKESRSNIFFLRTSGSKYTHTGQQRRTIWWMLAFSKHYWIKVVLHQSELSVIKPYEVSPPLLYCWMNRRF